MHLPASAAGTAASAPPHVRGRDGIDNARLGGRQPRPCGRLAAPCQLPRSNVIPLVSASDGGLGCAHVHGLAAEPCDSKRLVTILTDTPRYNGQGDACEAKPAESDACRDEEERDAY